MGSTEKFVSQPEVTAPKYLQSRGTRTDTEQIKQQTPSTIMGVNKVQTLWSMLRQKVE